MKRHVSRWLLLWTLGCATGALAQEGGVRGQGWSVLGAQTVGEGHTALVGQMGWPGFSLGVLRGVAPRLDLGGLVTFNYGAEGIVTLVQPGLKLQPWVRLMLLQTANVQLGLSFAPGPFFYFTEFDTTVGLALPLKLTVGLPVSSAVMLNFGLDMPFYVTFGQGGGPVMPLLVGGGMEYFIDRSLAATFNVRMGPTLFPYRRAAFTLEALFGIAWRL